MTRVLAVDDDATTLAFVRDTLSAGHAVETCSSGDRAMQWLETQRFDLVITDLDMPPPDGFALLEFLRSRPEPPPVAVLSGLDTARATLRALSLGACDYLLKPVAACELVALVERAASPAESLDTYGLVGASPAMQRVRRIVPLLAKSRESVLLVGETGTGKELLARALHRVGGRTGPFVAHNLAATPAELGESLFFGHVRGAFTGAHADHEGLFEQARGGTLLLDEIDSAPLPLQAKLLRVLETGVVQRVGGREERPADVRVVAASAMDPGELVARGAFRADLYYRLRQLEVVLPPLRDRLEDVPELVQHVLRELSAESGRRATIAPAALDVLRGYDWPGNVRELRHAIRSAALFAGDTSIRPEHLPRAVAPPTGAEANPQSLQTLELDHIKTTLERAAGNLSLAARWLGIDRGTLARKLKGSKPR